MPIEVRPATAADAAYIERSLTEAFHGTTVAVHGELIDATTLPGAVAWLDGERIGLLTYRATARNEPTGAPRNEPTGAPPDEPGGTEWEVVTLAADRPGRGAGGALLGWVRAAGVRAGAARIWLVTTNDNVNALRFYQRFGFDLVAVHRDAVTRARRLKPAIPLELDGIPLRHELELEIIP